MNIDLEALSQIPQILELLTSLKDTVEKGTLEKRWLNTIEVAEYAGYSKYAIETKVKDKTFIKGIHYHKPSGQLMFDKVEIDNWIMGIKPTNSSTYKKEETDDEVDDEIFSLIA